MTETQGCSELETRQCVECGSDYQCHKESKHSFCPICNYLATDKEGCLW